MAKMKGAIEINTERCKGCSLCVEACPLNIIALADKMVNRRGYRYVQQTDQDTCTGCTSCAIVCPDGCITVYRKRIEN